MPSFEPINSTKKTRAPNLRNTFTAVRRSTLPALAPHHAPLVLQTPAEASVASPASLPLQGASPFAVYKHFMIHASCRHLCDLCDLCGLCAYCGCVDVYMPGAANLNPYLNGPASASKSPGKCTKNTARFLVDSAKPGRTEATKMGKGFAQLVNWYVYVSLPC